jgi:hypothetical protein
LIWCAASWTSLTPYRRPRCSRGCWTCPATSRTALRGRLPRSPPIYSAWPPVAVATRSLVRSSSPSGCASWPTVGPKNTVLDRPTLDRPPNLDRPPPNGMARIVPDGRPGPFRDARSRTPRVRASGVGRSGWEFRRGSQVLQPTIHTMPHRAARHTRVIPYRDPGYYPESPEMPGP